MKGLKMFKFIRPEFFDIFGIGVFFIYYFYIRRISKNFTADSEVGIDYFVGYRHTWIFSGHDNSLSYLR